MNIQSIHAKKFLLPKAINHYMENKATYHILTLADDNEPFTLDEVIYLQHEKVKTIESEVSAIKLSAPPDDPMSEQAKEYYIARDKKRFLEKQLSKATLTLNRLKHRKQVIK